MRWLIVGAGAVGQVLARAAQRGGAEVAFKARRPVGSAEFRLHDLRIGRRPRSETFRAPVLVEDREVAQFDPDVLVLTVPSDALAGPWLPALLAAAPRAQIVAMEPGPHDAATIERAAPGRATTRGIVAFIAYQAPLPGEALDPGIAVWAPLSCPFSGPDAEGVASILRRGGLGATSRSSLGATASFGAAAMALYVTSLRKSAWRLDDWFRSTAIDDAGRAFREAADVLAADRGQPAPGWVRLLTPAVVRAGTRLARRLVPLPLEAYLAWHFTKVSAQTAGHLAQLAEAARRTGQSTPALDTFR